MAIGRDHSNHEDMLLALNEAQNTEQDNRERAREAHLFVTKKDGQWEPYWWTRAEGKPRYTFDQVNAVVDQIAGEMETTDFVPQISPMGGEATEEVAETQNGLLRNIQQISNANDIYEMAGRNMITAGIDGWRVNQAFVDHDSFDQDIVIERVPNWVDRVWLAYHEEPDGSDAPCGWILTAIEKVEYKERFPEGSEQGVTTDITANAYFNKADTITIGEYLYIEEVPRKLALMTDGRVLEMDDDFEKVRDELANPAPESGNQPVTVEVDDDGNERIRTRMKRVVHSRLFDGGGWLRPAKPTVFSWIPLIPIYGNFNVIESKLVYWGQVEKLMDPQRVMNYSLSREIEEGAYAPRRKHWMTQAQAEGYENTLATMNTNADPVQFYNVVDGEPPPFESGGAQINPGLRSMSQAMQESIAHTSGSFAANMGDNPGLQSGIAIKQLLGRAAVKDSKWFSARKRSQRHTARIIIDAIPRIYRPRRQVRILAEDGASSMVTIGEQVQDQESGQLVTLNDLSAGKYDVTIDFGPNYSNRQEETVDSIIKISEVDPSVIQMGGDILLRNITAPGMDQLAERKRAQLLTAGVIPIDQMTDEEKTELVRKLQAAQQQGGEPDPATMLGQAELMRAETERGEAIVETQERSAKLRLAASKDERETAALVHKIQGDVAKFETDQASSEFDQMMQFAKAQQDQNTAVLDGLKTMADTLNAIREAIGADAVVSAVGAQAYGQQAELLTEGQQEVAR